MQKVLIIGCPGSGKSHFARRLRDKTGLPLYYLDMIWHKKNKKTVKREKFDKKLKKILSKDSFIIDGNYSRTLELRLAAADTVFLFDFDTDLCLKGARERIGTKREDFPYTEAELDSEFENWISSFKEKELPKVLDRLEPFKERLNIITFTSREDVENYFADFDRQNTPPLTYKSLVSALSEAEKSRLLEFFKDFSIHCLINKKDKRKLEADFERAIVYYIENGFSLEAALCLIDPKNLGGFYARPPVLWFPLDDAAKIYPLSMEHGRMSVFRLSVYLDGDIKPELLQMALNFTIKRFPTLATTLKKGFFWHYLDTAKRRFGVREEWDIPCSPLKVSRSGSGAFRVLYFKNRISAEFFHVLTDGTGATAFLKALTAEYLRLTGEDIILDESDFDINEIPAAEEFENAFKKVPKSENSSGFVDKPALQMNGRLTETKPCRILHFKMEADSLKAAAKFYNTTVTAYMLALMFIAARAATDELSGDMSFQVPVNMRKYYPFKTLRNFSMYCGVRIPVSEIGSVADLLPEINSQLAKKTSKEAMSEMLTATGNTVNMLKYIPLVVKQPVAKLVYGFLGDNIFTSTISNMGVVKFCPSVARHILGMDFVLGTSVLNRVSCSMVTVNNTATFSVSKNTADPSFEEKLYELLIKDGVKLSVEGSELYEY